ncbi:hypothetical protein NQ315_013111 [Exocentrus adspersus]|uniref:Secreted protein n=1 Tax=Exocentrus adspersus TaxID=1586481 RepID=A0AAV8VXH7_9CUCU|nr:hypothetical protein NQ315_013111 [Exocentrus adspersus]
MQISSKNYGKIQPKLWIVLMSLAFGQVPGKNLRHVSIGWRHLSPIPELSSILFPKEAPRTAGAPVPIPSCLLTRRVTEVPPPATESKCGMGAPNMTKRHRPTITL